MVDWQEFRTGVARTRRYILSHHEPCRWYRCYNVGLFGRRVRLCARCSGIYPGIIAGLLAYVVYTVPINMLYIIAIAPLPALIDWSLTTFTAHRGTNSVRTITGLLLGYGYGLGIGQVFINNNYQVIIIGIIYGAVAAALLFVFHSKSKVTAGSK